MTGGIFGRPGGTELPSAHLRGFLILRDACVELLHRGLELLGALESGTAHITEFALADVAVLERVVLGLGCARVLEALALVEEEVPATDLDAELAEVVDDPVGQRVAALLRTRYLTWPALHPFFGSDVLAAVAAGGGTGLIDTVGVEATAVRTHGGVEPEGVGEGTLRESPAGDAGAQALLASVAREHQ